MKSAIYLLILILVINCTSARWQVEDTTAKNEVVLARKIAPQTPEQKAEPRPPLSGKLSEVKPGERINTNTEQLTAETKISDEENTTESLKKAQASRQRAKENKSKPLPVTYTGDAFIREVLPGKNIKEGTIVTIQGNATIRRGSMTLSADTIKIFGEDSAYARASGNLRIADTNSQTRLSAKIAEFYKLENKIIIRGLPLVEHNNKRTGRKSYLRCHEIERLLEQQIITCRGQISLTNKDGTIFAGEGVYDEKRQIVTLSENPRAFSKDNILLAQKMIYNLSAETLEAKQEVRLFLTDSTNQNKKSDTLVTTIIDADYAIAEQGEKIYLGQKITLLGERVKVSRTEAEAWAGKIEVWGQGGQEILATDRVELLNRADSSRITGENLRFFKIAGIAVMKSVEKNGQKIRPQAIFYDREGKHPSIVEAETLERNSLLNRSQARGNVEITMPRESTRALIRGEWADVDEKKQIVIVRGNPSLEDTSGKMYAREIVLFAAENRFELIGPIQGAMSQSTQ